MSGRLAVAAGTLIGALLLWDTMFRAQLGFSVSFLEEMWSRNIANLLMSPLRPLNSSPPLMTMSLIRLAIGIIPVSLLALVFFGFNLWGLGLALVAFFVNLVLTAWAIGLVVAGLVLRNGMGAEGARLVGSVLSDAARLRLLSRLDPAGMAAIGSPGACRRPMCSRDCGRRWSAMSFAPI